MPFSDAIRIGASGAGDYEVERSLRFNDGDSPSLTRSPSGSGNQSTFTFSWWQKITQPNDYPITFSCGATSITTGFWEMRIGSIGLYLRFKDSSTVVLNSNDKFRDPSAWYHCVIAVDTTQATSSNRIKMYVNNRQITSFENENYPSQNFNNFRVNSTDQHQWGYGKSSSGAVDGPLDSYLAEINFIDGSQYDPSYFGETDAVTGQWNPKKYTGSYGTNGYYLNFSDNSGTTATTLGKDSSGNGNNFTPNNFSVAAGKDDDSSFDTPTNNFPTLSPVDKSLVGTMSNGNLRISYNYKPASKTFRSTMALPSTGKIYWEWENEETTAGRWQTGLVRYTNEAGVVDFQGYNDVDYLSVSFGGSMWNGTTHINPAWSSYPSFYSGERVAFAIDCSNGKVWIGKVASNGSTTWYDDDGTTDGDPANGTNETCTLTSFTTATEWMPVVMWHDGGSASSTTYTSNINFGNHSFLGTVPNGFGKLCSANLSNPTIKLPNKHFDTLLYSGTGSSQNITGLEFQPDWVWIKKRSGSDNNNTADAVRGAGLSLRPNTTGAETSSSGAINAFLSNGFTVVDAGETNEGGHTYVGWNWNAGDTDGKTYTVKVVSDSGNKYRFDNFGTSAVTLDLVEGGTYIFNMDDSSNATHPFSIGTAANGTVYTSGITYFLDGVSKTYSQYTSGFSSASTRRLHITVPASAPQLYYWCSAHSGMGGAINTNSTLGSSNFDGSIQATAKVNASAGFSIVTFSGSGNRTIGHGLGVAPQVIIMKGRNVSDQWTVGHQQLDASNPWHKGIPLNTTASTQDNATFWNDTAPTSTVFSKGTWDDGYNMVAYCFSEVAGYSKFGKYTGNGNADGTFVFTGFRPAWIMLKRIDTTNNWHIADNKRQNPFNVVTAQIYPNLSNAEVAQSDLDIVSNGFKIRNSAAFENANGGTYIYFAFAEAPFKNARAR